MSFLGWLATVGWAIVVLQNGLAIARWIVGKVREAQAIK